MTGERKREDDSDFLDDDFIVEDIAGKNEDLDQLFEVPGKPKKAPPAGAASSSAESNEVEDVLFTDHTTGLDPSFAGTPEFAENAESTWSGDGLEVEMHGMSKPKGAGKGAEDGESQDEEFELDSESTLEVVGAPAAGDGVEQFEQSGPFTVEDGEEARQESQEIEASSELSPTDGPVQPGWEPLPAADLEALAEGPDLARMAPAEGTYDGDEPEGELVGAGVGVDGHQGVPGAGMLDRDVIRPVPSVRGLVYPRRSRLLASAAVSLLMISAAAVVLFRPELVGLHLEPQRVEQAQVQRPTTTVDVPVPNLPTSTDPVAVTPTPAPPVTPVVVEPPKPEPPVVPVAVQPPKPEPPVVPVAVQPPKPEPPVTPVVVVAPTPDSGPWPVPVRRSQDSAGNQPGLIRVNDDLKIGEHGTAPSPAMGEVKGILPGGRAFAQLHNGNYFIGGVKSADADIITLKLDEGEITLKHDAIARLTELGSSDYAELQKVTSGFVRLTNNNRLVGGILSQIADDYVVLEVRKNRVMVPRSAIGALVQGDDDLTIRIDTTREEDEWLRRLAERELGTGQPMMSPSPTTQKPTLPQPSR